MLEINSQEFGDGIQVTVNSSEDEYAEMESLTQTSSESESEGDDGEAQEVNEPLQYYKKVNRRNDSSDDKEMEALK